MAESQKNIELVNLKSDGKSDEKSNENFGTINENENLSYKEKKSIILIFLMYFVQGIPLGFFSIAIKLLISNNES